MVNIKFWVGECDKDYNRCLCFCLRWIMISISRYSQDWLVQLRKLLCRALKMSSVSFVLVVRLPRVVHLSWLILGIKVGERALFGTVGNDDFLPWWETLLEGRYDCWVNRFWKVNREANCEFASRERIPVHWHTLADYALYVAWLYNRTRHHRY